MAERIPDLARIERDGSLTLPPGWSTSFEHQLSSFAAFVMELPITYESGRRVPLRTLQRGWLR